VDIDPKLNNPGHMQYLQDIQNTVPNNTLNFYHRLLGHLNERDLKKTLCKLYGLKAIKGNVTCIWCDLAKAHKKPFNKTTYPLYKETVVGKTIHTDQMGPITPQSRIHNKYIITFIDEASRYITAYGMKALTESEIYIKRYMKSIKNLKGTYPYIIYCDGHGTYTSHKMETYIHSKGTNYHIRCPYVEEQNPIAEANNKPIMEGTRVLLIQSGLPPPYWEDATHYFIYIKNRIPKSTLNYITPYQKYTNTPPNYNLIHTFGCLGVILTPKENRQGKVYMNATLGIYLGIASEYPGCKMLMLENRKIITAYHIKFYEYIFPHNPSPTINPELFTQNQEQLTITEIEHPTNTHLPIEHTTPSISHENDLNTMDIDTLKEHTENIHTHENTSTQPIIEEPQDDVDMDETEVNTNMDTDENIIIEEEIEDKTSLPRRSSRSNKGINTEDPDFVYMMLLLMAIQPDIDLAHIEPKTMKEALSPELIKYWKEPITVEMKALHRQNVFGKLSHKMRRKIERGKLKVHNIKIVFKIKYDENGNISRYKVRICVQGCSMSKYIDFEETFSPCARQESVRLLLAMSVHNGWNMQHIDLPNAYINAETKHEIAVYLPAGWNYIIGFNLGKDGEPVQLLKALYGTPDAGKLWNDEIHLFIISCDFIQCTKEPGIYYKRNDQLIIILVLWVDDIFYAGNDIKGIKLFEQQIHTKYKARLLGKVKFALGVAYEWQEDGTCLLNQHAYIDKILDKFRPDHMHPIFIPLNPELRREIEMQIDTEEEKVISNAYPYRAVLGSLLYLALNTRPDIAYAVNFLARFCTKVNVKCIEACHDILRYIQYTRNDTLHFNRDMPQDIIEHKSHTIPLNAHTDSSYGDCKSTSRSTGGYVIRYGTCPIYWRSKLQPSVATSPFVAELFAGKDCCVDVMFFTHIIDEIYNTKILHTPLHIDNNAFTEWTQQKQHGKGIRHVDISYHYPQELFKEKRIVPIQTKSEDEIADALTKPLPRGKMVKFRKDIQIKSNAHIKGD
jgi:hypothetical protein